MFALFINSNSTSLLEKGWQFCLFCLQLRVATNVLLIDEDVGDCGLSRHVQECGLDRGAII
jgi:hypothetical protein